MPSAVAPVADFLTEKIYIAHTENDRVIKVTLPEASTPDATWNDMTSSVAAGNIGAAATYFSSGSVEKYRAAYLSIGATDLAPIISQIPALSPVAIEGDSAQYRFDKVIEGVTITFPVEFIKENGIWKIVEF